MYAKRYIWAGRPYLIAVRIPPVRSGLCSLLVACHHYPRVCLGVLEEAAYQHSGSILSSLHRSSPVQGDTKLESRPKGTRHSKGISGLTGEAVARVGCFQGRTRLGLDEGFYIVLGRCLLLQVPERCLHGFYQVREKVPAIGGFGWVCIDDGCSNDNWSYSTR